MVPLCDLKSIICLLVSTAIRIIIAGPLFRCGANVVLFAIKRPVVTVRPVCCEGWRSCTPIITCCRHYSTTRLGFKVTIASLSYASMCTPDVSN